MRRFVATSCFVLLMLLGLGTPAALAGPMSPPTFFGYAGERPLVPSSPTGIARPTPAPAVDTGAFGAATTCMPAGFHASVVRPTPAPRVEVAGAACDPCAPCGTCCPPCPTTRVADDPLSVPTVYWSSGYHDGEEVRHCDPCAPCVTRPVYRSPCAPCDPCEPCVRPVRVVRRCAAPCASPCYAPCYAPCRPWCGPRLRVAVAPTWGWGWGIGWRWGGCW